MRVSGSCITIAFVSSSTLDSHDRECSRHVNMQRSQSHNCSTLGMQAASCALPPNTHRGTHTCWLRFSLRRSSCLRSVTFTAPACCARASSALAVSILVFKSSSWDLHGAYASNGKQDKQQQQHSREVCCGRIPGGAGDSILIAKAFPKSAASPPGCYQTGKGCHAKHKGHPMHSCPQTEDLLSGATNRGCVQNATASHRQMHPTCAAAAVLPAAPAAAPCGSAVRSGRSPTRHWAAAPPAHWLL